MKYYIFIIYCSLIFYSVLLLGQDNKLKQYKHRLKELSDKLEKLIIKKKNISEEKYLNNVLSLELRKLNKLKKEYKRLQNTSKNKPQRSKPLDELPDVEIPKPKLKVIKLPKQYLELGDLYWKQHLYKKAMNAYINGITNTESPLAKYKLACAYEKNGHWKKAIKQYADIIKNSTSSEITMQAKWSLNYLRWKNSVYDQLTINLPSQKQLNSILADQKKPDFNKLENKKPDTNKIAKEGEKDKTTDKKLDYHLFQEKRKVWILLEKLKNYQKELLRQQNKLVRNLDKLTDTGKKLDAYRFQQIISKIETYNKSLEDKKKIAEEALKYNEKNRLKSAYNELKPYEKLTQITSPIMQTIMNLNKDINRKMFNNVLDNNQLSSINLNNKLSNSILNKKVPHKINLNKKISDFPLHKKISDSILRNTYQKPIFQDFKQTNYLSSWYPKMENQINRLSKIINNYFHLTNSKTAIYFSRLKNYINNSREYPKKIHNIAEELRQSISEGKNVRQWLQKKKESGHVNQESETLKYFLNTKDVKIDVEKRNCSYKPLYLFINSRNRR